MVIFDEHLVVLQWNPTGEIKSMKNVKFSVMRVLVNSLDENITDFHTLSGFNLVSRSNSKARTTSSNDLFALNLNQF